MGLMIDMGRSLFFEIIQILLGCLMAYGLYKALIEKKAMVEAVNRESVLLVILSSLVGLVLPMSIFGVIPIILAAYMVGLRLALTLPLLASNFLFNMLVPFTEVGFNWKTGWLRVVLAFLMGLAAGLLLSALKIKASSLLRDVCEKEMLEPKNLLGFFHWYMSRAGLFIVVGVLLEIIFKQYFFYDVVNIVNISSISTAVFAFIEGYDITSPLFILNMVIFNLIMNLKTLSGVIMLFKWKASVSYYLYFAAWVLVLCIANILV